MRTVSEPEKGVIVLLVILGGFALWFLGERLVFLAGSETAEARVAGNRTERVHVTGTVPRPQGNTFDTTKVSVSFQGADGQFHWSPDMAYFFAAPEPGEVVTVRYDPSAPEDARLAGVDLFGVPLLFALLMAPVEWLRRRTARSMKAKESAGRASGAGTARGRDTSGP